MNPANTNTQTLLDIDHRIDELVRKIELLSYVNPTNIEAEKERFFASKYLTDPIFTYPNINFDRFNLHRKLFSQPIELIEDEEIKHLYQDIIYSYSGLIQCIETIGEGRKFYYNSLHSFGTPTEDDVENAKFILHFEDEDDSDPRFLSKYNAKETEQKFRNYSERYDFTYNITFSNKMSAIAMVLNNIKTLVINANHKFSIFEERRVGKGVCCSG